MNHTQIKTFEDACKALNIEPVVPIVDMLPERDQKAVVAQHKLGVIARALNEGWQPDWDNFNQLKYYPWFVCSGSRFAYIDYYYAYSHDYVRRFAALLQNQNIGKICWKAVRRPLP